MVVFNNTLDIALQIVCTWEKKDILTQVTIIRDVYGKVSFLMNNMQSVSAGEEADFKLALERDMGGFFSGRIFWKKQSLSLIHI